MSSKHESWTSNATNSTNVTNSAPEPSWSPLNVFGLFAGVAGVVCTLCVLAIFLARRSLRNSFGVYLINLLTNEAVLVLLYGPLSTSDTYYHKWILGYDMCMFVNFLGYTYQTLIIWAHFLIAINRIWAVTFPFAYRTYHSTKFAVVLCCSVWVAAHLFYIPVTLRTAAMNPGLYSGTWSCDVDTTGTLYVIVEIGLFVTPMVLVILSYPYVCYKSFFSDRKQRVAPHLVATIASGPHQAAQPSVSNTAGGTVANTNGSNVKKIKKIRVCGRELSGSMTGFATLTLMTLSVAVCLLPKEAFFTYLIWADSEPPGILKICDVLQRLTAIFDPILIVLANTKIRSMVIRRIRLVCN